jgi:hypothetical protein
LSDVQLIYCSASRATGDDRQLLQALRDILSVSRRNNERDGITGYLAFDKAYFFQVLEGPRPKVTATYERISKDPRHGKIVRFEIRDIRVRSFPEWSMGGSMRDPENQSIYLRHGVGSTFDPSRLKAPTVLALAMDLQDRERAERLLKRAG